MARGEVKIRQGEIDDLIDLYHQAYADIADTLTSATAAGKIQKFRTLAAVKAALADLGDNVDQWVRDNLPQYYLDGVNTASQQLAAQGIDVKKLGMAPINRQAIASLVDATALDFASGISALGRSGQQILNTAVKQQLNFTIAEGRLSGAARKTISNNVKQVLADNGLSALTDRAGRQWSFDVYARMLARTKAVEARNQGLTNRMLASGFDLVQVSDHNSSHPACADWEGQILSLTGQTEGYPTVDEATADGLFHPNCQHAINVISPDLAAETEAYDNPYNYLDPAERDAADLAFATR